MLREAVRPALLKATISMVEGNRGTFQISDAELASRRRFVTESRQILEQLQKDLRSVKEVRPSPYFGLLIGVQGHARATDAGKAGKRPEGGILLEH